MIKEGHLVLIDSSQGQLRAYVFESLENGHLREIPIPAELATRINSWVEELAPGIYLEPDHRAPDCLFRAVKK